ncbi:MAG TPA: hypothetical protein PK308_02955 [Phycisphaerales bacterium]|nr:hypothetical protein [Phycisphaerales bacterium]
MQGSEIAAYTGIGAIGLLTIVKGLSALIRTWNGDRKDDKADKSVGNQIDVLERENKDLREENNRLRDDWKRLAKEEAALSARIQGLEGQVKEQNERIANLSRLIIHLVKVQGKDIPPDVVLSIIVPLSEESKDESI